MTVEYTSGSSHSTCGHELCPFWVLIESKLCQVSKRWHTQHVYLKELFADLSDVSSLLIQLRRYQSSQSQQRTFGGRKSSFDERPDLTQDFCLLPHQQPTVYFSGPTQSGGWNMFCPSVVHKLRDRCCESRLEAQTVHKRWSHYELIGSGDCCCTMCQRCANK